MSSTTPFFGREAELGALREALDDPRGKAVLVVGPQGMGKTWLIERFLTIAEADPRRLCVTMSYQLTKDDEARFFLGLVLGDIESAVQNNAGFFSDTPRGRTQLKAVMDVLPKGKEIRELFETLRGQKERHPRDEFVEYLTCLSRLLGRDDRAIVAIDANKQLHDHSDDTWRVIAERLPERVMLVFGQRPEDVLAASSEFLALPNVRRIPHEDLHALADGAVEELVAWAARETGIRVQTLGAAMKRYEGHPYALTAAVDLLRDGVAVEELPPDPTPQKIAAAQWNRVKDRHGPDSMRLLKAHAVLEVPASGDLARAVSELDVDRHESLLANRFIASLLRPAGERRSVYHAILRDHILAQLDGESAREYHRRAADAYRAMLAGSREQHTAPDPTAASRAFLHAGEAGGLGDAVVVFVNECTAPLKHLGLLDVVQRATEYFLATVAKGSVEYATLVGNLGLIARTRGDLDGAERLHREALKINRKLGRLEGQAAALGNLGAVAQTRGDLDGAERLHRESLEIERKLGRLEGQASDLGNLGLIALTRGDLDGAERLHRESLEIERKLGRLEGQASDLGNLGLIAGRRGDLDGAERLHREALEINRKLGRLEGQASDLGNLGLIAGRRGDLDGAERLFRESLEIERKLGRLEGQASQLGNLGLIARRRGDLDGAERLLREALEINRKLGRLEGQAIQLGNLGAVAEERGEFAEARRLWTEARDLYARIGVPGMVEQLQGWIDGLRG